MAGITCDIEVFGHLNGAKSDGTANQHIGVSDLLGRLRLAGIDSVSVVDVASGHGNVALIMSDKSMYFLQIADRFAFVADDLRNAHPTFVVFGKRHLLALTPNGQVLSAGSNSAGQLGRGTSPSPANEMLALAFVHKLKNVVGVACGDEHSAAVTSSGDVYTWGSSQYGQCGGERKILLSPFLVHGLPPISSVVCGDYFTLALSRGSGGHVFVWGDGTSGQLGIGTHPTFESTPRNIPLFQPTTKVACGYGHVVVLAADKSVYSWGLNTSKQLGHASSDSSVRIPTRVAIDHLLQGKEVVNIMCGPTFTALLDSAGRVHTFGSNLPKGRLGHDNKVAGTIISGSRSTSIFAQCGSAVICLMPTSITHADASAISSRGGTPFTIFGAGLADIKGKAWVRFVYRPQVDIVLEAPWLTEGEGPPSGIHLSSPQLNHLIPPEMFPLKNLELSISIDGSFFSAPFPMSVFRPVEYLYPTESQCGPISGGTVMKLTVQLDDIPYPYMLIRMIPDKGPKLPDIVAVFVAATSTLEFVSPAVDDPVTCTFAIAPDGKSFQHFDAPVFIYYDCQVISLMPTTLSFGGSSLTVCMSGLGDARLFDMKIAPRIVLSIVSSGAEYNVPGRAECASGICIMRFECPAITASTKPELAIVNVSFNGPDLIRCGQVEFAPPRLTKLQPASGPRGRAVNVRLGGDGFFATQATTIHVTGPPEPITLVGTYVDGAINVTLPDTLGANPAINMSLAPDSVAMPFSFYDDPTAMKVEPMSGAVLGGYVVKINGKGFTASENVVVRVTPASGPAVTVLAAITGEPNAKTGLGTVSFTMPAFDDAKSCNIDIALNGSDFASCADSPFIFK